MSSSTVVLPQKQQDNLLSRCFAVLVMTGVVILWPPIVFAIGIAMLWTKHIEGVVWTGCGTIGLFYGFICIYYWTGLPVLVIAAFLVPYFLGVIALAGFFLLMMAVFHTDFED